MKLLMVHSIKDLHNLATTVINTNKLNDCFIKYFDKLIIGLCGQFIFNTTLYLRYSLESLKRQFCISNVLAHLFFCNRPANSNDSNCKSCSRLFVNDASAFVSSIRYPLLSYFQAMFLELSFQKKDLELLFTKSYFRLFSLDVLFHSGNHYTLADSKRIDVCILWL